MFCEYCHLVIAPGEQTAQFKAPRSTQTLTFHRREPRDCYWKYLRDKIVNVPGKPQPIQAT
jgi:hypothetical protein